MEFRGIPWATGAHELLEGSWSLAAISRNAARIAEKIGPVVEVMSIQILDGGYKGYGLEAGCAAPSS